MELFYLTPKYFKPDYAIYNLLGINQDEKFIILRFVSWNAQHDKGQMGLSKDYKIKLVHELSKIARVFISAEGNMPDELQEYRINIPPEEIHHVLYFAELFVGKGETMASECAAIGTPAIYVNSLNAGTLENQEKEGLIYNYRIEEGVLERALEILENDQAKEDLRKKVKELNKKRIDLTDFLFWLITDYPDSKKILLSQKDCYKKYLMN